MATKAKILKYEGVEYPQGYVIAKCGKCKTKKTYDMAVPLDHMPMCTKCFMPMFPQEIVSPV